MNWACPPPSLASPLMSAELEPSPIPKEKHLQCMNKHEETHCRYCVFGCLFVVLPVGGGILPHQADNFFGVPHLSVSEDKNLDSRGDNRMGITARATEPVFKGAQMTSKGA